MRDLPSFSKERPIADAAKWVAFGFTAALVVLLSHHEVFHQDGTGAEFSEAANNGIAVDV